MALQQIELEVPTTLSDIKLWQYQKYMKILEQNKTEDAEDQDKVMEAFRSYGTGLTANRLSRYSTTVWPGRYIPGTAWFDYDVHQNMAYHVTTQNYGVEVVEKVNVAVYPNPVTNNSKLYVSSEVSAEYKTVQIMDQSGRVINTVDRPAPGVGIDVNLATGVYFVKFIGENSVITDRIIVE